VIGDCDKTLDRIINEGRHILEEKETTSERINQVLIPRL
jgi:hypothetical protein